MLKFLLNEKRNWELREYKSINESFLLNSVQVPLNV